MLPRTCRSGIYRNFIFQSFFMNHFSKYSFCHRRTTNIPQADEYNLHARPSFQLFAFIITDEPTPSQKNVCMVLERNELSKNPLRNTKTRFLQILADFFIIAVMGHRLEPTSQALSRFKRTLKESVIHFECYPLLLRL